MMNKPEEFSPPQSQTPPADLSFVKAISPRPKTFRSYERWKEILEDWKESKKSIKVYCNEHDLTESTFRNWKKKIEDGWYEKEKQKLSILENKAIKLSYEGPLRDEEFVKIRKGSKSTPLERFEIWKRVVPDWEKSGLSMIAYCHKHKIGRTALRAWIRRFSDPEIIQKIYERITSPGLRHLTPEQWNSHIEDWKKSGLSMNAFCLMNDLEVSDLKRWLKELGHLKFPEESSDESESSPQNQFIPLTLGASSVSKNTTSLPKMEVVLPQDQRITIEGPVDWKQVFTLLKILVGTQQDAPRE